MVQEFDVDGLNDWVAGEPQVSMMSISPGVESPRSQNAGQTPLVRVPSVGTLARISQRPYFWLNLPMVSR
jgi:hypothetical protein